AAVTSARGSRGGQVTIDGGAAGRLFSSGTTQATGLTAPGGAVELLGREVVLAGATVDAAGQGESGAVHLGGGGSAHPAPGQAAAGVTVTATTTLRGVARASGV